MIVLSTLNARYAHASLGLRYLRANLGPYREQARLMEFTTKSDPAEMARAILECHPRLVGFGVYIWNTDQTLILIRHLRELRPDLLIVAGGPEIAHETVGQPIYQEVDFVFQGEADFTFRDFVMDYFDRGTLPVEKIVRAKLPEIREVIFPYDEYTDEDLRQRKLYVEASRGCPYKCEYCLSSLDVSVRSFDLGKFLEQMQRLIDRGARQFKFVDRTFNLSPTTSAGILRFFLERVHLGLFMHFELVPDRLPDELKELIEKFPPSALQFEVGIQTWNPDVARNVSRRQNYEKIAANFRYLRQNTEVHTHADLIVGLPGESFDSFAAGFNALYALEPDEIQVGILKRLKGTPIIRHDQKFGMRYSPRAPFQILETKDLPSERLRDLEIFADFWDHLANSGRFPHLKNLAASGGGTPFEFYYGLAHELQRHFGRSHSIHLDDLEREVKSILSASGCDPEMGRAVRKRGTPSTLPSRQAMHLAT